MGTLCRPIISEQVCPADSGIVQFIVQILGKPARIRSNAGNEKQTHAAVNTVLDGTKPKTLEQLRLLIDWSPVQVRQGPPLFSRSSLHNGFCACVVRSI